MPRFSRRFQCRGQRRINRNRQRSLVAEAGDESERDAASVRGYGEQQRGGPEGPPRRRAIGDPSAPGPRRNQTLLDHNQSSSAVKRTVRESPGDEREHGRRRAERRAVRPVERADADEPPQFPARRLPRHCRPDAVHRDAADTRASRGPPGAGWAAVVGQPTLRSVEQFPAQTRGTIHTRWGLYEDTLVRVGSREENRDTFRLYWLDREIDLVVF